MKRLALMISASRPSHLALLAAALAMPWFLACSSDSSGAGGSAGSSASGGSSSGFGGSSYGGGGGEDTSPPRDPSGYLLITQPRMAELAANVAAAAPEWVTLKGAVDEHGDELDIYTGSPENVALVYLLTQEPRYAALAYRWAQQSMDADDVAADSYLHFGDRMREIALVLNYCADALSETERAALRAYLKRWTDELWFDNQGSGWGIDDPGNNYHMAFLEGTAFAGYALRAVGDPAGQRYLDVLKDKLERPGGVLEYTATRAAGGDWPEGVNYGQRGKQRLYAALSAVASMGDPNYFTSTPFFAESVEYAVYQAQPGFTHIFPAGDLPRDASMPITPHDREYLQMVGYWSGSQRARDLARWYLTEVVPDYTGPAFNDRTAYWYDVIFRTTGDVVPASELPLAYVAKGTGFVSVRTSWRDDATSLAVSGSPIIDQSHAHHDVGSFTLWKHDWLAVDATTYSDSGLNWSSDAHNMVHMAGAQRRGGAIPGLQRSWDSADFTYLSVDATNVFRARPDAEIVSLADEYTRELVFLKPNTLVTFDRVAPKDAGRGYDFRVHFAAHPERREHSSGAQFTATNGGGGIALAMLLGGATRVTQDSDLEEQSSQAWRVEVAPVTGTEAAGRFLGVLEVASGEPPIIDAALAQTSSAEVYALRAQGYSVAFSSRPGGAPAALPFSYEVSGDARTHILCNVSSRVRVRATHATGSTQIEISEDSNAGSAPNDAGIVVFRE